MKIITQNPYRTFGVLSNSPLKERVGNQNRLSAFAKIGKETSFPNDFDILLKEKPERTEGNIALASASLNLDKDQLKYALFWFINASPMDEIALKHLQVGNKDKALEIFQKKETFSSLINTAVLAFIDGDAEKGFNNLETLINSSDYKNGLLESLGLHNIQINEEELTESVLAELMKETSAKKLLNTSVYPTSRSLITKKALEQPIAFINSAVAVAKKVEPKNAVAQLEAGTTLMNSTKSPLNEIKELIGLTSSQYQLVADNIAKQVLQCGINYYNNAPESDLESPKKALVLQGYALSIAVGQLTKDRCKENYDIIKKAVDNMPPAEVALETRRIKDELKKFCQLPDKIVNSISLLNTTKPLLQTIKTKVGSTNAFYLSISTQIVANALHNLIEEVNIAQSALTRLLDLVKEKGIDPSILNLLNNEMSPRWVIDNKIKPTLREAWKATLIMDTFDMESDFKINRYTPNRNSLRQMCTDLGISTYVSNNVFKSTTTTRNPSVDSKTTSKPRETNTSSSKQEKPWYHGGCFIAIVAWIILGLIAGAICESSGGDFSAGFCIAAVIVLIVSGIINN